MKKFSNYKYLFILYIFVCLFFINKSTAQTYRQEILKSLKFINKEKLIDMVVKENDMAYSPFLLAYVFSDKYVGKAIICNYQLYNYYIYEILDSIQRKTIIDTDYYNFAKKILLLEDTLKFTGSQMSDAENDWVFSPVSVVDSIINYPEERKEELIKLNFDENAVIRDSINIDFVALIAKLIEWNVFVVQIQGDIIFISLFDYTIFQDSNGEPTDMINDCLISFLDHIGDVQNLYVMTDYYPYNFYFRDNEMDERKIKYITTEELRNKSNTKLLKDGIRVVYLDGMKLENDLLKLKFSESTIIMKKKRQLAKIPPVNSGDFIYQYSPITQSWNLIEVKYDKY